jgi:hypothetical protein
MLLPAEAGVPMLPQAQHCGRRLDVSSVWQAGKIQLSPGAKMLASMLLFLRQTKK